MRTFSNIVTAMGLTIYVAIEELVKYIVRPLLWIQLTEPEEEEGENEETEADQWNRLRNVWQELLNAATLERSKYEIMVSINHPVLDQVDQIRQTDLLDNGNLGLLNIVETTVEEFGGWSIQSIKDNLRSYSVSDGFRATFKKPGVETAVREEVMPLQVRYPHSPYLSQQEMVEDSFNELLRNIHDGDVCEELERYGEDHWWISDRHGEVMDRIVMDGERQILEIQWRIEFETYRGKLTLDGGNLYGG
jgi:hypothetical protein